MVPHNMFTGSPAAVPRGFCRDDDALLKQCMDRTNWVGFSLQDETTSQLVPDVHAFPGHIACDSASNSELVASLWPEG